MEANLYEGKDVFLWLPTSFGKSFHKRGAAVGLLDHEQSEFGTGWVATALS